MWQFCFKMLPVDIFMMNHCNVQLPYFEQSFCSFLNVHRFNAKMLLLMMSNCYSQQLYSVGDAN